MLKPSCWYALSDSIFVNRLDQIIKDYSIEAVVETGVNEGKSTVCFAAMVNKVYAIDNDQECLAAAANLIQRLNITNVELILGNSPDVLKEFTFPERTVYFLDAHWDDYWPLLDEIAAIPRNSGIIIIHDILVPDKSFGWGFGPDDTKGDILTYGYVKDALTAWSPNHVLEYNTEAHGIGRGIAYLFPDTNVI